MLQMRKCDSCAGTGDKTQRAPKNEQVRDEEDGILVHGLREKRNLILRQLISLALVIFALIKPNADYTAVYLPETELDDQAQTTTEALENAIEQHDAELDMLAQVIYREARGVASTTQQAAIVWCILNRVDDPRWPDTIAAVIWQPHQFAWTKRTPITAEFKDLARDVFIRWQLERLGYEDVGRVLPKEFVFFTGYRGANRFRTRYRGGKRWDWSLPSPYEN